MVITTRFSPGDTAFFIHENEVTSAKIEDIQVKVNSYGYTIEYEMNLMHSRSSEGLKLREKKCFATKAELLDNL